MTLQKLFILPLLVLSATSLSVAQTIFKGVVKYENGETIPGVSVLLLDKKDDRVISYAITDDEGAYKIKCESKADPVILSVRGFNIKEQRVTVSSLQSQTIDFTVQEDLLVLREIVVRPRALTRRSDTLTYLVSSFIDSTDRVIGDVLKKMPGIKVGESGAISYQGKAINKFYIDGLDMLGGKYGIATNNVSARDIATVDVYERHQPIKALQGESRPESAALNIKLKPSRRGTFAMTGAAGAGYKPFIWDGELVSMFFGRKLQFMGIYKANNIGMDASSEQQDHHSDGDPTRWSPLSIYQPVTPPINQQRYLENNIHTGSLNSLFKLSEDLTVSVNMNYANDVQIYNGQSSTSYYMVGDTIKIDEETDMRRVISRGTLDMDIMYNAETFYLNNVISATGSWGHSSGRVSTDGEKISQRLSGDRHSITNSFSILKVINNFRLHFYSKLQYKDTPFRLNVTPLLYPFIFDQQEPYSGAHQWMHIRGVSNSNNVNFHYSQGKHGLGLSGGIKVNVDRMESTLNPIDKELNIDSLRNNSKFSEITPYLNLYYSFIIPNQFDLNLGTSIEFQSLKNRERISGREGLTKNTTNLSPSLRMSWRMTPSFSINSSNSYYEGVHGGVYDIYSGYVMSDYRTIGSLAGLFNESRYHNHNLSVRYSNAIYALFATLEGNYFNAKNSVMYDYQYIESLSKINAYKRDNRSDGYRLKATISKRFETYPCPFTIQLEGSYNHNNREVLRQSDLIKAATDSYDIGALLDMKLWKIASFSYDVRFIRSKSKMRSTGDEFKPINNLRQFLKMNFFVSRSIILSVGGEGYFNNATEGSGRQSYFLDASIRYKRGNFELELAGRNLTNEKQFSTAFYQDITSYRTEYSLRPLSVMLKAYFKIL